jgi:hypothetical protein
MCEVQFKINVVAVAPNMILSLPTTIELSPSTLVAIADVTSQSIVIPVTADNSVAAT